MLLLATLSLLVPTSVVHAAQEPMDSWLQWADYAWKYFQPGVAVDRVTGINHANRDWARATDWDLGTYLIATLQAEELSLIPRGGAWGADYRIEKILSFLENRPITAEKIPYLVYDSNTGGLPPEIQPTSTNPSDTGNLLIALHLLRQSRPELSTRLNNIVYGRYNYAKIASDPSAWSSTGDFYAYYSAQGFKLWGFDRYQPVQDALNELNSMKSRAQLNIYGVILPQAWITSEPLLLGILDLNLTGAFKDYSDSIYQAQKRRYDATGIPTAWSEGQYSTYDGTNTYIYQWIATGGGQTWFLWSGGSSANLTPAFFTKVAFAYQAIYPGTYSQLLLGRVQSLKADAGFLEGMTEDGRPLKGYQDRSPVFTDKTNAMVISAALYASRTAQKASIGLKTELSSNTFTFGGSVTMKAVFSRPVSDGQVTFEYRTPTGAWNIIAGATLRDGSAEYKWIPPKAGTYEIRAKWDGNQVFAATQSTTYALTVNKAASTTTLALDRTMARFGEGVTLSGRVTPAAAGRTIQITYSLNGAPMIPLTNAVTDSAGAFSMSWKPTTAGVYYLRASWSGDANYEASNSSNIELRIEKTASLVKLVVDPKSIVYGGKINVTLTTTPATSTGTASIVYSSDLARWFEAASGVPQQGLFKAEWSPNATGAILIKGFWSGDENYLGSETEASKISVDKAPTTTSLNLPQVPVRYGENLTITLQVTPPRFSGQATLFHSTDASKWDPLYVAPPTGGYLSYNWNAPSAGRHFFKATWSGDPFYAPSTSPVAELSVEKAPVTIGVTIRPERITYGEATKITLKIKPSTPTGSASLTYSTDDGVWKEISARTNAPGLIEASWQPAEAGTHQVKATWSGDDNTLPSETPPLLLEVAKAPSTITLKVTPTTLNYGANASILSTLNPKLSTGVVAIQFSTAQDEWRALFEEKPSDGTVNAQWIPPTASSFKLRASWSGDQNHLGSQSEPLAIVVSKAPSIIELTVGKKTVVYGEAVKIEVKISPTSVNGTVRILHLSDDGSTWTELSSGAAVNGSLVLEGRLQAGSHQIRAEWSGDDRYRPSESQITQLTVKKANSTITLDVPPKAQANETITISGLLTPATPGVKITLLIQSPTILLKKEVTTDPEGRFKETYPATEAGTATITASWVGTKNIEGAEAKATVQIPKPPNKTEQPKKPSVLDQQTLILLLASTVAIAAIALTFSKWRSVK